MGEKQESELSQDIKMFATRHASPPALRGRVMAALRQADSGNGEAARGPLRTPWQQWAGMGVAFVCGALATGVLTWELAVQGPGDRVPDEVVADHVRSLMAAHLTDVASSDQHTVKPWFNGRLDFAPPVNDLARDGFSLLGGRLDYLDHRTVAVLVYRHRQHTINLFVWPSRSNSTTGLAHLSQRGFNLVDWDAHGLKFWAVSDLNSQELEAFATVVREAAANSPG
ncbi:MAG: anti-sigma factor family protein [Thiobacillaceae bacterium]